jgi:YD repeat-containing protein
VFGERLARTTRYRYDELNRLKETEFADGSRHLVTYRADGRKETETDPRGVVSTYGYDAAGRVSAASRPYCLG